VTTVLEDKIREVAEAIIDTAKQFHVRLTKAERVGDELKLIREQLRATRETIQHVQDQLRLTYEALDQILHAMKVDEERHVKEHADAEAHPAAGQQPATAR